MFPKQDMNSYFKDEITFSVAQHAVFQQILSNLYLFHQSGALKMENTVMCEL